MTKVLSSSRKSKAALVLHLLLLCLMFCGGCGFFSKSKLPPDPGLIGEDFGCGIHIGMAESDAKLLSRIGPPLSIEVISPEGLISRNPYNELEEGELLLALCPQSVSPPPSVEGIRCYANSASAELTFKGAELALLATEDAERILGPSSSKTQSSDGKTHLLYHFAIEGNREQRLRLTLSFEHTGRCFALELLREATEATK